MARRARRKKPGLCQPWQVAQCTAGRGLLKHGLGVKNRKDDKYDLCPDYAALAVDTPSLEPLCLKDPSKKVIAMARICDDSVSKVMNILDADFDNATTLFFLSWKEGLADEKSRFENGSVY